MNDKVKDFFRNSIGYIVVACVSAIYLLTSFLTIDKTGKTIAQILADGAISFCMGLFINRILELQGMLNGERDELVKATVEEHGKIVMEISPAIDRLDEWCETRNKENYRRERTKILANVGLKYSDCFDEDGVAIPYTMEIVKPEINDVVYADKKKQRAYIRSVKRKLRDDKRIEKKKRKGYKKAVKLKLTRLVASELTSEGGRHQDIYYFGRTKAQYQAKKSITDVFSKLGIACIIGYYGVSLVEKFNYANLIWVALQIGMFIIMGVIKMLMAYTFVTGEYRGRLIKKIDNLQKFDNYIKSKGVNKNNEC